jgi:hypothetical protein
MNDKTEILKLRHALQQIADVRSALENIGNRDIITWGCVEIARRALLTPGRTDEDGVVVIGPES